MKHAVILAILTAATLPAQNTAIYPPRQATDSDLFIGNNSPASILASGLSSSGTTATVLSGSGYSHPSLVSIDGEIIAVCDVSGTTLTFGRSSCPNIDGRGFDSTEAVSHLVGANVQNRIVAWQNNQKNAEIEALENVGLTTLSDRAAAAYGGILAECAVAASAGKTLVVSQSWTALTTQNLNCDMAFVAGGKFQPASGQVLTFKGSIAAPPNQWIFDTSLGGTASIVLSGSPQMVLEAAWFGALAKNTSVDVTVGLAAAITSAQASSMRLHVASGHYAISSVTSTSSNPFSMYCDGPHMTTIQRHSAALQASTPLLGLTNATSIDIQNCGWNEFGNGTNYTNAASVVLLENTGPVTIENNFCTLAQSNCFLVSYANDVRITNNTCTYYWYACIAVSGSGPPVSPNVTYRTVIAGNTGAHGAVLVADNVFNQDSVVSNNTAYNSAYYLETQAQTIFDSNISDGAPDYGLANAGMPGGPMCLFAEGVYNLNVTNNYLYNCGYNGMQVSGSEFGFGPVAQYASSHILIAGNHIQSPAAVGIQYIGHSYDNTTEGAQVSIKGNFVENAGTACYVVDSAIGVDWSDNTADTCANDGLDIDQVQYGRFHGGVIRNIGGATVNSYYGINIANETVSIQKHIDVYDMNIVDEAGTRMRGCVLDGALQSGNYDMVRSWNNSCTGYVSFAWVPAPAATIGGTAWSVGDQRQNFPTMTGQPLSFVNLTAGSGNWGSVGYLPNSGTISISSCGTSPSFINGNANQFVIQIGGGGVTSCTLTWSMPFSGAPIIIGGLVLQGSSATPWIFSLTSSVMVVHFTADSSGAFLSGSAR